MNEVNLVRGDYVFREGEEGNELYIIEEGKVNVLTNDASVLMLHSGEMAGEHSLIFGRPRNVDAKCVSERCKLHAMRGGDFYKLLETHPSLKESIRDICVRREFQKAICSRTGKPFPKTEKELKDAFDLVDSGKSGAIELRELRTIIKRFDPFFTEQDIREILNSLDLDRTAAARHMPSEIYPCQETWDLIGAVFWWWQELEGKLTHSIRVRSPGVRLSLRPLDRAPPIILLRDKHRLLISLFSVVEILDGSPTTMENVLPLSSSSCVITYHY
eukprot:scaffold1830_cov148-Amphora_coffeaeformis.AAC.6